MHPPSPQLLRALRCSISNYPNIRPRNPSIFPITRVQSHPTQIPRCRYNSNITRASRMVPRAHTNKPTNTDRGPASTEATQTDFSALNVLGSAPAPTTAIDKCLANGFELDNGLKITNGDGLLLVGGEAFAWRPWLAGRSEAGTGDGKRTDKAEAMAQMVNRKGQFEADEQVWGLLGIVWPRPDLLMVGTGESVRPLSPETRRHINSHGIRIEVLDTRNAAAQFNLLATERGVSEVAAALIPIGWSGGT